MLCKKQPVRRLEIRYILLGAVPDVHHGITEIPFAKDVLV